MPIHKKIGAALSSPAVGFGLSFLGGERANRANSAEALANRNFQERLSNTSYQRGVKDLRAAGLNPILAARFGGASTPGGAQAQIKDSATPAVNTGLQLKLANAQVIKAQEEAKKATADARNAESQNKNIPLEGTLLKTKSDNLDAQTSHIGQQQRLTEQQVKQAAANTKSILAEVKNIQQRNKNLQQEWNISNVKWRELESKLPEIKYQAYLDSTKIVKVLHAIEKGIPVGKALGAAVGGTLFLKNQAKGKTTTSVTTKHKSGGSTTKSHTQ
jgi:hypothetical protein